MANSVRCPELLSGRETRFVSAIKNLLPAINEHKGKLDKKNRKERVWNICVADLSYIFLHLFYVVLFW